MGTNKGNPRLAHMVKDLKTSSAMQDFMIDGYVYHLVHHLNRAYNLTDDQIEAVILMATFNTPQELQDE